MDEEKSGNGNVREQSGEAGCHDETAKEPQPREQDLRPHAPPVVAEPVPAIRLKEYLALVLAVVLADVTVYHGGGLTGLAVLFILAPLIVLSGATNGKKSWYLYVTYGALLLLALRLFYLGWWLGTVIGFFLTCAFALAVAGCKPFIIETFVFSAQSLPNGISRLGSYAKHTRQSYHKTHFSLRSVIAPICAVLVFGLIFVMANPVLRDFFRRVIENIWEGYKSLVPSAPQVLFWFAVLWCMAGLLRPWLGEPIYQLKEEIDQRRLSAAPQYAYPTSRNVLSALIVLFAVYLVFEFYYLWLRPIPEGLRYSEYAHEGAAWLTFALAISTVVLGAIFKGGLLLDPRIARLKNLTWVWSFENFVLAICAFHRTQIYVHYNGLSRLRVVAVGGIAVVTVGFILVVWKVARQKNFFWLIRRHILALGMTVYLLFILPIDYVVTRYNVKQIMAGNPAPTVQIAVHRIGPDGCLRLLPLLGCEDETIQQGVRALLAQTHNELMRDVAKRGKKGWTYFQLARTRALRVLENNARDWQEYLTDPQKRSAALQKFNAYGRRWYD